jgi:hypothetical protein
VRIERCPGSSDDIPGISPVLQSGNFPIVHLCHWNIIHKSSYFYGIRSTEVATFVDLAKIKNDQNKGSFLEA